MLAILACLSITSCKKDDSAGEQEAGSEALITIPEFYSKPGSVQPEHTLIADRTARIASPQDLDFNPTRPNELWVINKGTQRSGGSTVMFTGTGTPEQKSDYRQDGNAWHFMSLPSALSFSHTGDWATTPNIQDANHAGGTFAGPTLWSGNLDVYARDHGPDANGSHFDMLHASPFSMGIESERDNIYWVFDGYNGNVVKYNFAADHGPGQDDHSDGKVHRYTQVQVKRDADVPSHLVLDKQQKWLYIVDGGNKRILRMDIQSGRKKSELSLINERLAEYWEMEDVTWEEFLPAATGFKRPCGIELNANRLFVSDYETGEIRCFDINTKQELGKINTGKKGIMGVTLGPDQKLYYVNALANEVLRIDPQN